MGLQFINQAPTSGGGGGGTITSLSNGLTLAGSVGQLGGTLSLNTTINLSSFSLTLSYPNAAGTGYISMTPATNTINLRGWASTALFYGDIILGQGVGLQLGNFLANGTGFQGFQFGGSAAVTQYIDALFSVGMNYINNYSANFQALTLVSKNYVDASVTGIAKVVASFRNTTLSATTTLLSYNIGATGSELFQLSVACVILTGGGSYAITVTYFDATNTNRSITMAAAVVLSTPSYIVPLTFSPFASTLVVVTATLTGSATAQAFGILQYYPV